MLNSDGSLVVKVSQWVKSGIAEPSCDKCGNCSRRLWLDQNHLIWLDAGKMTGLEPDSDRIIEIAIVITDSKLETVAEAPVIAGSSAPGRTWTAWT